MSLAFSVSGSRTRRVTRQALALPLILTSRSFQFSQQSCVHPVHLHSSFPSAESIAAPRPGLGDCTKSLGARGRALGSLSRFLHLLGTSSIWGGVQVVTELGYLQRLTSYCAAWHHVIPGRHRAGAGPFDLMPHRCGCRILAEHPRLFPSTWRTHEPWLPVPSAVGRVPSCWPLAPLISPSCIGPSCPGAGGASGAVLRHHPKFPTWRAQCHGSAFIFSAASLFSLQ